MNNKHPPTQRRKISWGPDRQGQKCIMDAVCLQQWDWICLMLQIWFSFNMISFDDLKFIQYLSAACHKKKTSYLFFACFSHLFLQKQKTLRNLNFCFAIRLFLRSFEVGRHESINHQVQQPWHHRASSGKLPAPFLPLGPPARFAQSPERSTRKCLNKGEINGEGSIILGSCEWQG